MLKNDLNAYLGENSVRSLLDYTTPDKIVGDKYKNTEPLICCNNEELSIKEMRLGGLRIDPKTFIGSRTRYFNNVKVKFIAEKPKVNKLPMKKSAATSLIPPVNVKNRNKYFENHIFVLIY